MTTKIFCPRCSWAPTPLDRWICLPGCHTVWNTFETNAWCPGCQMRWQVTWCHACGLGSPHEDWYHDDESDADHDSDVTEREEELAAPAGAPPPA